MITSGLEMLKLNPWDLSTLKAMANACEQLQFDEVQLAYLKLALDVDITDRRSQSVERPRAGTAW